MPSRGFTLMEVVLAIGLAGVVLGLLTMSIDMYLVRVDASRTQVETSQLARTLLNNLAEDLHAARYFSASSNFDDSDEASINQSPVRGIFGTETELRIDRSAIWRWDRLASQIDVANPSVETNATPDSRAMPQTVRYLLGEGKELLAAKLAATGVGERPTATGYAGLYREQLPTAAWQEQNFEAAIPLASKDTETADLIAPEVVEMTFAYFDGQELRTEWDSGLEEGLPEGIEIRLTLLKEPFEQATTHSPNERDELRRHKENLVEFRRFVKLPEVREPYEAEFLQPDGSSDDPSGFSL